MSHTSTTPPPEVIQEFINAVQLKHLTLTTQRPEQPSSSPAESTKSSNISTQIEYHAIKKGGRFAWLDIKPLSEPVLSILITRTQSAHADTSTEDIEALADALAKQHELHLAGVRGGVDTWFNVSRTKAARRATDAMRCQADDMMGREGLRRTGSGKDDGTMGWYTGVWAFRRSDAGGSMAANDGTIMSDEAVSLLSQMVSALQSDPTAITQARDMHTRGETHCAMTFETPAEAAAYVLERLDTSYGDRGKLERTRKWLDSSLSSKDG